MRDDEAIESALRAANEFYYRAFAARDLVAMEALWAQDGVACVHPGWPALIGRTAVIASYRDIFRNTAQEAVTAREAKIIVGDNGGAFIASRRLAAPCSRRPTGFAESTTTGVCCIIRRARWSPRPPR